MTAVAIHAVVHVPADALMLRVGLVLRMAVRALEDAVVVWIRVADRAHSTRSAMFHVEPRVSKRCIQPAAGRMASGAGCGEPRRNMVRTRRGAVILGMAAITVGRQRRVVVVHVATGTGHGVVRSREGEAGVVVIERGLRPGRRVVADVALLRKPDGDVVGIVRVLKIREMAGHACGVRQPVGIAPGMALAALQ